jgi:hypothetical protein
MLQNLPLKKFGKTSKKLSKMQISNTLSGSIMILLLGMLMITVIGQQNISSIRMAISSTNISEKENTLKQNKKYKNFLEQKKSSKRK